MTAIYRLTRRVTLVESYEIEADTEQEAIGLLNTTEPVWADEDGDGRVDIDSIERIDEDEDEDEAPGLLWETAGTDEPRDQNASSDLAPHSWWSLGPNGNETWSVELIVCDDTLTEIPTEGVRLGRFDTEQAAKAAAEAYERANRTEDAR